MKAKLSNLPFNGKRPAERIQALRPAEKIKRPAKRIRVPQKERNELLKLIAESLMVHGTVDLNKFPEELKPKIKLACEDLIYETKKVA